MGLILDTNFIITAEHGPHLLTMNEGGAGAGEAHASIAAIIC